MKRIDLVGLEKRGWSMESELGANDMVTWDMVTWDMVCIGRGEVLLRSLS